MAAQLNGTDISQIIAFEFGANASYVEELLLHYLQDPSSVDEEWRDYFRQLMGDMVERERRKQAEIAAGQPQAVRRAPAQPVQPAPAQPAPPAKEAIGADRTPISGIARKIVENMEASIAVPTATSQRRIPLKLLEENRLLINKHLMLYRRGKVSYTHLIAWAIVKALEKFPQLNDSFEAVDGQPYRIRRESVNLGIAVDVAGKDGSRTLLVPNIKNANRLTFSQFLQAYDEIVAKARDGKLQMEDFQGTTISLTNPGTIGTTASVARLMAGQGLIVATGAIEYPAEYQAMAPEALSQLGISKAVTISSTYDHRIIQGAESGAFLAYIEELLIGQHEFYDQIFFDLGMPHRPMRWAIDHNPALLGAARRHNEIKKQARVLELINAYRVRGHLIADIDPLRAKRFHYHPELDIETYGLTIWDLDREFITGGLGGVESATLRRILEVLRRSYCEKVGIEYRHIQSPEEKEWIRSRVELDGAERPAIPPETKKQMLWKLISAELFEKFLAVKYLGQKRFSIEGTETLVALLDQLIEGAAERGISDITIGMSHRGRLNVIANVIGRFCERIFTSFEGSIHPNFPHDQGDVKYHQGASGVRETAAGKEVALTVVPNPSHLEFVNPVVEGMVRAKQDLAASAARDAMDRILPVLIHGDAAFAGEGIVAETLNLSQLEGYRTGGTIHIIVNNQIGFTTSPEEGRSSVYCTDVAKMVQAPIFHVNGDDVEAAYQVLQIALDYRQRFHKDIVIDLIGFRRHGHNEGDEPTYTQPVMYERIRSHPGVRELYARKLISEGLIDEEGVRSLMEERTRRYENALLGAKEIVARQGGIVCLPFTVEEPDSYEAIETGVDRQTIRTIAQAITTVPKGFHLNPKIVGQLSRRAKMAAGEMPIDWGLGEALAFGSLLLEGVPVRLSGEDSSRGTFSQRHAVLFDTQSGEPWTPLANLAPGQARFDVYDSPLSEAGVLGFEYGYSVAAPKSLVLWEAQFGDFVNNAQVIVDQFIASGEEKWNQTSRLVLLLPHGYEGQGPEHSSARLERFLQLCAEYNIQVCNCTTPAQYFHLLRRQMKQKESKPLVIMTPKSLLRLPAASSWLEQFSKGSFLPLLADESVTDPGQIKRLILCSGKVYYDLQAERARQQRKDTAILRIEQLYPFPKQLLQQQLKTFSSAKEVIWAQEEPKNMGAWSFIEPHLVEMLSPQQTLRYVGRPPSASPATGSHTIHQMEQQQLVAEAFL